MSRLFGIYERWRTGSVVFSAHEAANFNLIGAISRGDDNGGLVDRYSRRQYICREQREVGRHPAIYSCGSS
jgi:hypothetical protein